MPCFETLTKGMPTLVYHLSSLKPVVKGVSPNPSIFINQPVGIWDIYDPIIVSFPIKNGGSFHSYVSLPEGTPSFSP